MPFALRIGNSTGLATFEGQMYDVNGLPSTVTSTRRSASFTVSFTAPSSAASTAPTAMMPMIRMVQPRIATSAEWPN